MSAEPQSVTPMQPDPQTEDQVHGQISRPGWLPPQQERQPLPISNLARFEDPTENPCRCCCRLVPAAKTLLVINLIYLGLWIWAYLIKVFYEPVKPTPDSQGQYNQVEICAWRQVKFESQLMTTLEVLIGLNMATLLVVTIGYTLTVFGCPIKLGTKTKILFCNLYQWSHFCNPSWLLTLLSFIDLLNNYGEECAKVSIPITWVVVFACILATITWYGYNGWLARAFRNALKRQASRASRVASQLAQSEGRGAPTANASLAGGDASKMPSITGTDA